ncbi:hypothetical protein [Brevundimonas sp.]|uniref:hypothetical protein n=1 Tax=Brevundimonas sp. TaxID=1871086 RepID=UPI002D6BB0FE|nr:hypothetical protein [Brevundimonas sp.]HYC66873.1 hypothetical protein [Brevundimonas sp.]
MPTSSPPDNPKALLEAACAEAFAAARWDEVDLSTRWPGAEAGSLLLAKAAECALSPIARDQLLSLALERIVDAGDPTSPLLKPKPDADRRAEIARAAFALGPHRSSETEALVGSIEERHARRLEGRASPARLAASLRDDAALHEILWDHPDIPGGPEIRLTMLCAVPRLRDRADELTTMGPDWLRNLMKMAGRARRGRSG